MKKIEIMVKILKNIILTLLAVTAIISLLHKKYNKNRNIHAVRYTVTNNVPNTPGGILFDQEIGSDFALLIMQTAASFVWKVLNQTGPNDERYVPWSVNLHISDFDGYAYEQGDTINISGPYLGSTYHRLGSTSRFLFASVVYHEMAHVLQWKGDYYGRMAPNGLIEGIADYVMVKSGFYLRERYEKPGSGSRWDQGYDVTERFLEYCDSLNEGFVSKLNKMMRVEFKDSYFQDLLGKNVSQLWTEYKVMHAKNASDASEMMNLKS